MSTTTNPQISAEMTPRRSRSRKLYTYGKAARISSAVPRHSTVTSPGKSATPPLTEQAPSTERSSKTAAARQPDKRARGTEDQYRTLSKPRNSPHNTNRRQDCLSEDSWKPGLSITPRSISSHTPGKGHEPAIVARHWQYGAATPDFRKRRISPSPDPESQDLVTATSHQEPTLPSTSLPAPRPVRDAIESRKSRRRPRLIDALRAESSLRGGCGSREAKAQPAVDDEFPKDETPTMQIPKLVFGRDMRSSHHPEDSISRKKVKVTYSHSRSIRNETQTSESLVTTPSQADARSRNAEDANFPTTTPYMLVDEHEESEAEIAKVVIKSVHELRRAGANNRFADQMEDLLSRIGQPDEDSLALRRNATIELARELTRPEFATQFRAFSARDHAFRRIGQEHDTIAGFALTAALVTFMTSGSAPHLLRQLTEDHVGILLCKLLRLSQDIDGIATERTCNMSCSSRKALKLLKQFLLSCDSWRGFRLSTLSPRTMALLLLDVLVRRADAQSAASVMREADEGLFHVAQTYLNTDRDEDIDFALLVSVLEAQSNLTTTSDRSIADTARWSLPVASCAERALQRWPRAEGNLEANTLKLSINMTNTAGGSTAFDRRSLLNGLASSICKGLSNAQASLSQGGLDVRLYDELLMILGLGINVFEHCAGARCSLDDSSQYNLLGVWLENFGMLSEADSEEKSRLSVSVGYLSVLLGYLCLAAPMRKKMADSEPGLKRLIQSIQEFTTMSRHVGNKVNELEALVTHLRTGSLIP